jgi:DNA polymerase elongation subunit (family B)
MLIDRDVQAAETYAKGMIADLLQNKVDMSQLVITKALAKNGVFHLLICNSACCSRMPRVCWQAGTRRISRTHEAA